MTGDEIVAEFSGEVYSARLTTTEAVQRFSATSLRLKHVYIREVTGSLYSFIGRYYVDRTTFLSHSLGFPENASISLYSIDLYNLGCAWHTGAAQYGIIGTY